MILTKLLRNDPRMDPFQNCSNCSDCLHKYVTQSENHFKNAVVIVHFFLLLNEAVYDECPCEHNGTCTTELNGYTCTCAPGYTGNNCETGKHVNFII